MSDVNLNSGEIELRDSNLYRNGKIILFPNLNRELVRQLINWPGAENDKYYSVRNTDSIDQIAYFQYKNVVDKPEWYWWVIADANNIVNPLDISDLVGSQIVIPDLQLFLLITENENNT